MTSDIALLVKNKIDTMVADGKIESLVAAAVEKSVESAISDSFRGYSDFTKSIEKAISETVKVDSKLGLSGYNKLVADIIRVKLGAFFEQTATKHIEEEMNKLLGEFSQEIKFSQIIEMMLEEAKDNDSCSCDRDEKQLSVFYTKDKNGYFDLYLDFTKQDSWHSCAFGIRCNKEGRVWSAKIDHDHPRKKLFMGPLFNFERFLFHAYTNKIEIIMDQEPDMMDLDYSGRDY